MKAIVPAAGKGNRLKPYTDIILKPLLSLHNADSVYNTLLTDILTKLQILMKHVDVYVMYAVLEESWVSVYTVELIDDMMEVTS